MVETTKKVFEVKKWNAVALWAWDIDIDVCAICKALIHEPCINCQANQTPNEECVISWGTCNHPFHFHCINRWLKTRSVCPLDNKEWDYARYGGK